MSNIQLLPEEPQNKLVPIKDLISIFLLIIGSILVSIGAFSLGGLFVGLCVVGTLLFIIGIILGL